MDTQMLLNTLLFILMGILGWFGREIWAMIQETKKDLASLREDLPKDYVLKLDFVELNRQILTKLDRIEDKLDQKMDKNHG